MVRQVNAIRQVTVVMKITVNTGNSVRQDLVEVVRQVSVVRQVTDRYRETGVCEMYYYYKEIG